MELTGSNKNITGMHTSSPYTNHHITRESSSETMDHNPDPDPFPITGASVTPISVGSKLMKPHMHITSVKYKECLKNHAANMGGNITDGCCEFMPSGDDGTLEALKCAACNCHRNFHRKEYYYPITTTPSSTPFLQLPPPSPSFHHHHHHRTPHPLSLHHHHPINASPVKVAFGGGGGGGCSGGGGGTESSSEELNFNSGVSVGMSPYGVVKKRFRTKFTQEQKDKMLEFAERVGWRIPREDDTEVQRFCTEVGVKRQVLKVWMHNNKATSGKKQVQDGVDSIN